MEAVTVMITTIAAARVLPYLLGALFTLLSSPCASLLPSQEPECPGRPWGGDSCCWMLL